MVCAWQTELALKRKPCSTNLPCPCYLTVQGVSPQLDLMLRAVVILVDHRGISKVEPHSSHELTVLKQTA